MKFLVFFGLVFLAISGTQSNDKLGSDINGIVDNVLSKLSDIIFAKHLDPLTLPNISKTLKVKVIFTEDVNLQLTHGWMQGLHSLQRNGDATMTPGLKVKVKVPVALELLQFGYDYHAKISFIGHHGKLEGSVKGLGIELAGDFVVAKKKLEITELQIADQGTLEVKVEGNLSDFIVNDIIKDVEGPIYDSLIQTLNTTLVNHIDWINQHL